MKHLSSIILLSLIAIFFFQTTLLAADKMVVRLSNPDHETVLNFNNQGFDIAAYLPDEWLDLVVTQKEYDQLILNGFDPKITQTAESMKNNLYSQTERLEGYRFYEQTIQELHDLADAYPDLVRVYNLGKCTGSYYFDNGNINYEDYQHNIWALKLTTNPDEENDKPAVFYMGAHHAREPLSTEVTMGVLNHFISEYETNDTISDLINKTEIWFIPIVNPDGQKIVLNEIDLLWRKNIRDNNNNGKLDAYDDIDGVDLNRNYSFEWKPEPYYYSLTYPGPFSASEMEVQIINQFLADHNFVAGITYHTYSQLVLYPFAYSTDAPAPDKAAMKALAIEMAKTIPSLDNNGFYKAMQSSELYSAAGILDDYAYGKHGIFCYTIELGVEFIPPAESVKRIVKDNLNAALILLKRPHHTALSGTVFDQETGKPVQAKISIAGIDDSIVFREPYESDIKNGKYLRLLTPGSYNVTFSAYGYNTQTIEDVVINDNEITNLNIELVPYERGTIMGVVRDGVTQLPIENVFFEIPETRFDTALSDKDGFFALDGIFYGNYNLVVRAENYGTHWEIVKVSEPEITYEFYLFPPSLHDVFDTADGWELDDPWGLDSDHVYVGDYSLCTSPGVNYPSNLRAYATLAEPIDLTNAYNASFTFQTRYRMEKDYDFCYLQMSFNKSTWYPMETFTGIQDEWTLKEYNLKNYVGRKVYLRFFFRTDMMNVDEGFFIDDLRVYKSIPVESKADNDIALAPISLLKNYPNPFNAQTSISFSLTEKQNVSLHIYNIMGQKIRTLLDNKLTEGFNTIVWDGKNNEGHDVGSGVYLYRLSINDQSVSKRMILLK